MTDLKDALTRICNQIRPLTDDLAAEIDNAIIEASEAEQDKLDDVDLKSQVDEIHAGLDGLLAALGNL